MTEMMGAQIKGSGKSTIATRRAARKDVGSKVQGGEGEPGLDKKKTTPVAAAHCRPSE